MCKCGCVHACVLKCYEIISLLQILQSFFLSFGRLLTRFSTGKLVIKIMNVGGRAVGRAGVNISFPWLNSAVV